MKKVLVILLCACGSLAAQDVFTRVRAGLDAGETAGLIRSLDSCRNAGYYSDSCGYYKGLVLLKEDKVQEARKKIREMKKNYPTFYLTAYLEALFLFRNEDYAGSLGALNAVLRKDPDNYKSLYNRALILGMLEDYKAAKEDLTKCIELAPLNPQCWYSRAYWEEMAGQFEEALSDYEKTVSLSERYYDAYLGMAHIYYQQKNNSKACESITRAIEAGSQMAVDIKENYCR